MQVGLCLRLCLLHVLYLNIWPQDWAGYVTSRMIDLSVRNGDLTFEFVLISLFSHQNNDSTTWGASWNIIYHILVRFIIISYHIPMSNHFSLLIYIMKPNILELITLVQSWTQNNLIVRKRKNISKIFFIEFLKPNNSIEYKVQSRYNW